LPARRDPADDLDDDAALALIDLELPMWQVRRLAYDEGE
jgi:hypothetical protein